MVKNRTKILRFSVNSKSGADIKQRRHLILNSRRELSAKNQVILGLFFVLKIKEDGTTCFYYSTLISIIDFQ